MRRRRRQQHNIGKNRGKAIARLTWAIYCLCLLRYLEIGDYVKLSLLVFCACLFGLGLYMLRKDFRIKLEPTNKLNRYNRLKANGGYHTEAEWQKILRRYNYTCVKCRQQGVELTKDHIVPVALGGTDNASNLQPLCRSCNSSKGTRIADYR